MRSLRRLDEDWRGSERRAANDFGSSPPELASVLTHAESVTTFRTAPYATTSMRRMGTRLTAKAEGRIPPAGLANVVTPLVHIDSVRALLRGDDAISGARHR